MKGGNILVNQALRGALKVLSLLRDSLSASGDICFHNLMAAPFISDKMNPNYLQVVLNVQSQRSK